MSFYDSINDFAYNFYYDHIRHPFIMRLMRKTLSDFDFKCYEIVDFVNSALRDFTLNEICSHFGEDYTDAICYCIGKRYIVPLVDNEDSYMFGIQAMLDGKFIF